MSIPFQSVDIVSLTLTRRVRVHAGPHLRKRQHMKIVQLESDKAGYECDIIQLKKEIKQLHKVHGELHELKQRHHSTREEYKKRECSFTLHPSLVSAMFIVASAVPTAWWGAIHYLSLFSFILCMHFLTN